MKRFRFRLEKVLNLRAREEDLVKVELKNALIIVKRCENDLQNVENSIREGIEMILKERSRMTLDLPKILLFEHGLDQLVKEKTWVEKLLLAAKQTADEVRDRLMEAALKRKKLEIIENKHKGRHEALVRAEERKILDEVAVVRFTQNKQ